MHPPTHLVVIFFLVAALIVLAAVKGIQGDLPIVLAAGSELFGVETLLSLYEKIEAEFERLPWGDSIFDIFNYGVFARLRGLKRSRARLFLAVPCLLLALGLFISHTGELRGLVKTEAVILHGPDEMNFRAKYEVKGESVEAYLPRALVFNPEPGSRITVAYNPDYLLTVRKAGIEAHYAELTAAAAGLLFLLFSGYPQWVLRCLLGLRKEAAVPPVQAPRIRGPEPGSEEAASGKT